MIPCKNLDLIAAACTFAVDINLNVVRGGRCFDARRCLLAEPVEESADSTVWSRDALCRDAFRSELLAETRIACTEALRRSNSTIALLGLSCALPPCTLCSFTDMAHDTS